MALNIDAAVFVPASSQTPNKSSRSMNIHATPYTPPSVAQSTPSAPGHTSNPSVGEMPALDLGHYDQHQSVDPGMYQHYDEHQYGGDYAYADYAPGSHEYGAMHGGGDVQRHQPQWSSTKPQKEPKPAPPNALTAALSDRVKVQLRAIIVAQRYVKKSAAPGEGLQQFLLQPTPVVSKRKKADPRHMSEVSKQHLQNFHSELYLVMKQLEMPESLFITFGDDWKTVQKPYMYLTCKNYAGEVRKLCPSEVPNTIPHRSRYHPDDITKDVTDLVLSVPELAPFRRWSFKECIKRREDLLPLYTAIKDLFIGNIANYEIEIANIAGGLKSQGHGLSIRVYLRTSAEYAQDVCLLGNEGLWERLEDVNQDGSGEAGDSGTTSSENNCTSDDELYEPTYPRATSKSVTPKFSPQSSPAMKPRHSAAETLAERPAHRLVERTANRGSVNRDLALSVGVCAIGVAAYYFMRSKQ